MFDEPTTHLDVDAVEALLRALQDYAGTIVFISHDIYFVRSLANAVFEVREGKVRKFPGNFDYCLEKKDTDIRILSQATPKIQAEKKKINEEKERLKEKERIRREEEKKRKAHNTLLREKINKLEKKKERLRLESYAKARALSNPRIFREEDTARDYGRRLKEIERIISEIDTEIKDLEGQIMQ